MTSPIEQERERLRYCEQAYSTEKERRAQIEHYAQFYFGIVTIFLAVISLNSEVLTPLFDATATEQRPLVRQVLILEVLGFGVSLFCSYLALAVVMFPVSRAKPYPRRLVTRLFSESLESAPESRFIREAAMRFALATERNSVVNTRKARWLTFGALSATSSLLVYLATQITLALTGVS